MNFLRKLRDALLLPAPSVPKRSWFERLTTDQGPDCDRCGKPTGKPHLYRAPRTPWRCDPCEREVVDILFGISRNSRRTETDD